MINNIRRRMRPRFVLLITALTSLPYFGHSDCKDSPSGGSRGYSSSRPISTGNAPRGVALDPSRNVLYSVNDGSNQLTATGLDGGTPLWTKGVSGPWGVAVEEASGDVFVSQYRARVVTVYDTNGNIVRKIGATTNSNYGEPGFFNGPAGLTVVGGWLVVTDPENNRFQVFSTTGQFEGAHGRKGDGDGAFGGLRPGPYGVAAHEATGQLYFADPALHRVSRWALNDGRPSFEGHFGAEGREPGRLWWPFAVSVQQRSGDVLVMSTNTFRIEVFSGCGQSRGTMGNSDSRSVSLCNSDPTGDTMFRTGATATLEDYNQFSVSPITVGVRFSVRADGFVTAVRFIKPSGDSQQHTVRVWDPSTSALLYSQPIQIDGCRPGSWVKMAFRTAVAVTSGRPYIVTIDQMEQYAASRDGLNGNVLSDGSSITITRSSAGMRGNSGASIPTIGDSTNYWVDVEFQTKAAYKAPRNSGTLTGFSYGLAVSESDRNGAFFVYVADAPSSSIRIYRVAPSAGPARNSASAPPQGAAEQAPRSAPASSRSAGPLSPRPTVACSNVPTDGSHTFYKWGQAPAFVRLEDGVPVILGQRLSFSVAGDIVAIAFFKADREGGDTHRGKVYETSTGRLLASTPQLDDWDCSGPGWVSLKLATPLAVTAGVGYTIAIDYMTHYVKTPRYLLQPRTQEFMTLARNGGVYGVAHGRMPTFSGSDSPSYWIDGMRSIRLREQGCLEARLRL